MKIPGYTRKSLEGDERVIRVARLHWVIYAKAMLFLVLAVVVVVAAYVTPVGINRLSLTAVYGLLALSIRYGAHAAWKQYTTEVAITDRRVIYKTGFVWRRTAEMLVPAIESIFVDQTILGRILDYGSIHVRGNGELLERLNYVSDPISVQHAINSR